MNTFLRLAALIFAALSASTHAHASTEADETVDFLIDAMRQYYVIPENGERAAVGIENARDSGALEGLEESELAAALTRLVHEHTDDVHFSLRHAPPREESSTLARRVIDRSLSHGFTSVRWLTGDVACVELESFESSPQAVAHADALMQNINGAGAIIFDLRRNGGGSPDVISAITAHLFETPVLFNTLIDREGDVEQEVWSGDAPGAPPIPDTPVFILTSAYTFSAAESFTYGLQARGRAVVVGEPTGGGAHMVMSRRLDHGFHINMPGRRARNPITGTNWEGVGVQPDIHTLPDDALRRAHLEAIRLQIRSDDPARAALARWALPALQAAADGFDPDAVSTEGLAGVYGPYQVEERNGALHLRRAPAGWRRLYPLTDQWYGVSETDTTVYYGFERTRVGEARAILTSQPGRDVRRTLRDEE